MNKTIDDIKWEAGYYSGVEPTDYFISRLNEILMEHDANSYYKKFADKQLAKVNMWNEMRKIIMHRMENKEMQNLVLLLEKMYGGDE